jgi:Fuc2NAc and GlcNAc transferase
MNSQIFQFTFSSILTFLLLGLLLPQLRKKLLDVPNQRSSHIVATPRGGGITFVIIGTLLNYIFSTGVIRWIPIICLPLSITGTVDDYKGLPASWRYIVQAFTATILILISNIEIPFWQIPLYIFLVTSMINFMNFMDGLDGIVAGCSVILFIASSNWSLSGAIFGFLLWNWSPAKVFMGDTGSTYIGAVFAGLAFQSSSTQNMLSLIFVGFPLFADALTCVIRRLFHGDNIFKAHKQHLYQRLNQAGWTHSQVATLYVCSVFALVFARAYWSLNILTMIVILEILVGVFLDQAVATRFDRP